MVTDWTPLLRDQCDLPYWRELQSFLTAERARYEVYPPAPQVFAALQQTPYATTRVVILGQDPYHGPGQAHGLCFSVNDGVPFPPSLKNIFAELKTDIGMQMPMSGNLTKWANEGVLLLNATLTVRAGIAGSHQKKGWENFTDAVIKKLSDQRTQIVFLLWGRYAQNKRPLINPDNDHLILTAVHPSPLSAHGGFFGCRHFSKTNAFLLSHDLTPIDWNLNTQ